MRVRILPCRRGVLVVVVVVGCLLGGGGRDGHRTWGRENALFDLPDLLLDLQNGLWSSPLWAAAAEEEEYDAGDVAGLHEPLLWADDQCWLLGAAAPVRPD
ncbi:hypothetical protein PR202_gb09259 [Eleusine coracana subsp. coracana]|uniref:Secreted protein n=1 Tax=Eleusine coracana subsp. coracana TaxID=191504 RepID=A0AAV5EGU5_ELECO|nr:hypothetical protein PR202_gb09259 [Eleusine coracana subsp. coracana]